MGDAYSVATQLRMRMRRVEDDERFDLVQAIEGRQPKTFEGLEPATASWLMRIEAKLDCLLAAMGMPPDNEPIVGQAVDLELSETGLVLVPDEAVAIGDLMLVELEFPGPPPHTLMALARALDASETGPGALRLDFECLHEDDRQAILDHSLHVQRRALRLRSGVDGDPS